MYGPIPAGREVHHQCENKGCWEGLHLVALTRAEHLAMHSKESCSRGHPYPESKRPGRNDCAVCHREDERARYARSKTY